MPLPGQPGTTVTGRLTECTVRPLPNQEFTLTPIYGEGTLNGFTIDVPGYEPVTITEFGRFSLFGLTSYLLGDMCLSLEIGDEEDLLPWRPDRSLTWEDFKADPPADVEGRDEAAFIKYRLIVEPTEFRLTYDPNTKTWRATIDPASLKVKNVMVRSESWVDPQRKNARLLSHEQGHFDISEVYRRLLERRLRELVAEAPTQEQAAAELRRLIERTYNSVVQKAEQVQTDYDRETAHGQDRSHEGPPTLNGKNYWDILSQRRSTCERATASSTAWAATPSRKLGTGDLASPMAVRSSWTAWTKECSYPRPWPGGHQFPA